MTGRRAAASAKLQKRKRASLAQALFVCARLYDVEAMERVRARIPFARRAHTRLLPYISLEGSRLTEIARGAEISKQAAGQLVDDLVARGLLERTADPDDGRAQQVRFTDRGLESLLIGFDALDEIERKLAARLGRGSVKRLQRALARLAEALTEVARDRGDEPTGKAQAVRR